MRNNSTSVILLLTLVLTGVSLNTSAQPGSVKAKTNEEYKDQLFNDIDLNNWTFYLSDASVNPAEVFSSRDGVIHIAGNPYGYMRTKGSYSDYRLHLEYRWPGEATNSGVFIHTQLPDTLWPQCIECQLANGNAGDFICMNGADIKERTDKSKIVLKKHEASSEKPVGEWNIMEVSCKADTIEVYINGMLQNKGTGVSVDRGHICLQSEGKEVEFRNVYLIKLKK
jgi:hypothetical protein